MIFDDCNKSYLQSIKSVLRLVQTEIKRLINVAVNI